jgi:hypothetical protein
MEICTPTVAIWMSLRARNKKATAVHGEPESMSRFSHHIEGLAHLWKIVVRPRYDRKRNHHQCAVKFVFLCPKSFKTKVGASVFRVACLDRSAMLGT